MSSGTPVVINNGSDTIKAGFAGEVTPRVVIPAVVGRPKALIHLGLKDIYIGQEALDKKKLLNLTYPIVKGLNITPVLEGRSTASAVERLNVGGNDLTDYLGKILSTANGILSLLLGGLTENESTIRDIKEKLSYVALDYNTELQNNPAPVNYTLPDGNDISLGSSIQQDPVKPTSLWQSVKQTVAPLANTIHLGIAFLFIFMGFSPTQSLLTNIHPNDGSLGLALLYFTFAIGHLFLLASALIGFAAAILWTSQPTYVSRSAPSERELGKYSSVFQALQTGGGICGNGLAGVFSSTGLTETKMLLAFASFTAFGAFLMALLRPVPPKAVERENNIKDTMINVFKCFKDTKIQYVFPLCFLQGQNSVPTSGGTVTIKGTHLSSLGGTVWVMIQDNIYDLVNSKEDGKSLYFNLDGSGAGKDYDFTLTSATIEAVSFPVANFSGKFSYRPPTITSFSVNNATLDFSGSSFSNNIDWIKVEVNGVKLPIIQGSLTHSTFQLAMIPEFRFAGTKIVNVSVKDNIMTPPYKAIITRRGGDVTIKGSFLNVLKVDGTPALVDVTIGTIKCTGAYNLPNGDLVCTMPKGTGAYIYQQSGMVVTLYGSSFAGTMVNASNVMITPDLLNEEEEVMTFTLLPDVRNGAVLVSNALFSSNSIPFALRPILESVTPAPTIGGEVTVSGLYLNTKDWHGAEMDVSITIGNKKCSLPREIEPHVVTDILCFVPPGVGVNYTVTITIAGLESNETALFSYLPPVITTIQQQGVSAIVKGTNFGDDIKQVSVKFGLKTLVPTSLVMSSQITFTIPEDAELSNCTITVAGQTTSEFVYNIAPSIESFTSVQTCGGLVTIKGHYMDVSRYIDGVKGTFIPAITIGQTPCIVPQNFTQINGKTLECILPPGVGADHSIHMTFGSVGISILDPVTKFSYERPTISNITQTNEKGGLVTITGTSFMNPVKVSVGAVECKDPEAVTPDTVICYLEPWNDSNGDIPQSDVNVTVDVGGQSDSKEIYVYDLIAYNLRVKKEVERKRAKWLIPSILIPGVLCLVALVALIVILVRKHKKNKGLKRMHCTGKPLEKVMVM
eukprot:gene15085-17859_t